MKVFLHTLFSRCAPFHLYQGIKCIQQCRTCFTSRQQGEHKLDSPDKYTAVERVSIEWNVVERLLPLPEVPDYPKKDFYPSDWKPPRGSQNHAYFVKRTKNHMLPVYLDLQPLKERRDTKIRYIDGDIWLMAKEIKNYLEQKHGHKVIMQVDEMLQVIKLQGDFVRNVREWLELKGF